jgi:hypothetical protein
MAGSVALKVWLVISLPPSLPAMNKQPRLQRHSKTRRRQVKLSDMPPNKDQKAGAGKAVSSDNAGIPTSLQEFLQRDSLPISSD